jgi:hypothetical protein
MATWAGTGLTSAADGFCSPGLELKDFLLFFFEDLVNPLDELIRDFLDLILALEEIIF